MVKNLFIYMIAAVLMISVVPQQAHADIFSDAFNTVKNAADDLRENLEKEAKNAAKSVKTVAVQTARQTVSIANQAAKEIKHTIDNLTKYFDAGEALCRTALQPMAKAGQAADSKTKALFKSFPKTPGFNMNFLKVKKDSDLGKINRIVGMLGSAECSTHVAEGFTCAVFPSLKGLVSDIQNAKDGTKRLAQYIDKYSGSSPCSKLRVGGIPTAGSMTCAVLRGLYEETRPGLECSSKIFKDAIENAKWPGGGKFTQGDANKICDKTGQMGFNYVASSVMGKAAESLDVDRLMKYSNTLKSALGAVESIHQAGNKLSELCKAGISSGETKLEQFDRSVLSYISKNAASGQMVMTSGTNSKCLTLIGKHTNNGGGYMAGIWDCVGSASQRWTYEPKTGRIYSDYSKNVCLNAPSSAQSKKGVPWKTWKCYDNPHQKFELIEGGKIYNKHTNMCANVKGGLKNMRNRTPIISWPCENVDNEKWVVIDQSAGVVTANMGAHRLIYSNPQKPQCLTMNKHGNTTMWPCDKDDSDMFWSIHHKKGTEDRAQIYDDRHGDCLTMSGKGSLLWHTKCGGKYARFQEFQFLPNGLIKNTGGYNSCISVKGGNDNWGGGHREVVAWPCEDLKHQKWHWFPR